MKKLFILSEWIVYHRQKKVRVLTNSNDYNSNNGNSEKSISNMSQTNSSFEKSSAKSKPTSKKGEKSKESVENSGSQRKLVRLIRKLIRTETKNPDNSQNCHPKLHPFGNIQSNESDFEKLNGPKDFKEKKTNEVENSALEKAVLKVLEHS